MIYKDNFYFGGKFMYYFSPLFSFIFVYQTLKLAACQIELGFLENKKPATQKRSGLITKHKQTSLIIFLYR
jgi:hypothetical protein